MAVIFDIEHKSDQGRDYKMEIIDNDGGSFIGDITLNADGFRIEDTGDKRDLHQSIIGKVVSFTIQVTNTDIENFLISLTTSDESRYFVKLYLNTNLIFIGVITTDNVTIDNAPKPYDFKLEAIDGIKLIKKVEYKGGSLPSTARSIENHLMMALREIPTASEYGVSDSFCSFALDWWSKEHIDEAQDSGSVLAKSYVQNFTFTKAQDPTGVEVEVLDSIYISCYDVIKSILEAFNCRLYYNDGYYKVEQFGIRENSTYEEIVYNKSDGIVQYTELTRNTITPAVDINQTDNFHLTSGKIKLLPPLKKVEITYNLNERFDFLSGRDPINYLRPLGLEDIGEFILTPETDTITVVLDDLVSYVVLSNNALTIENYQVCFKLELRVGPNSLTNKNGTLEWVDSTANPDDGVIMLVYNDSDPFHLPVDLYELGKVMTLSEQFTSPEVTVGGDVQFDLYPIFRQYDFNANEWIYTLEADLPSDIEYRWGFDTQRIVQTVEGQTQRRIPRVFSSEQDQGTEVYSRKVLISDGLGPNRPGNISIINSSSEYVATSGWKIGSGSGSYIAHGQFLAQTILSERLKVLRIYSGVLFQKVDFFDIQNTYKYDGFDLILNHSKLKTNFDEMTVEMIEVSIDTTGVTNTEIETQLELGEDISVDITGGTNGDPIITDPPNVTEEGLITSETIYADVAITSVPILEADDDYFVTGDEIIIKDNISGYEHKVIVAAPLNQGDTTITIQSFTPDRNIAIYSAITFAPGQLLNLRPKYQLFDNTTGTELTVTNFDLPDETALSNSEMSRRLRIFRQTSKLVYNIGYTVDSTNNKINLAWPLTSDEYVEVELL